MNKKNFVVVRNGKFFGNGKFRNEYPDAEMFSLEEAKDIADAKAGHDLVFQNAVVEVVENYGFENESVVYQA